MLTNALDEQFGEVLKRINPAGRRAYAKSVALALRAHRSDEILANRDADGKTMAIRKPQKPHRRQKNKSGKMFKKLGRRSSMNMRANASFASVSFKPKNRKIADNHHQGRSIAVNQCTRVKYPARTLMGMGKVEQEIIMHQLYDLIAEVL